MLRGGNRSIALIPIELIALVLLAEMLRRFGMRPPPSARSGPFASESRGTHLLLACAPLIIAAIQILPMVPGALWASLPGRAEYLDVLKLTGELPVSWQALSVAPRATAAALLAGIPIAAAFLFGFHATLAQLRMVLRAIVVVALVQLVIGLAQLGSADGFLMFGAQSAAPVGTFGNRNHFGDYMAVALCSCIALLWGSRHRGNAPIQTRGAVSKSHLLKFLVPVLLLIGLLVSRSRAAVLIGVPAAFIALCLGEALRHDRKLPMRRLLAGGLSLLALLVAVIGADALTTRFIHEDLGDAAAYRAELMRSAMDAAWAFFPLGSGWGTFELVYPRFQPASIGYFVNHAHMDAIEMLVEGGIFFLAFAALFLWLAARRVRVLLLERMASRDAVASAFCGIALLVPLLHSLVDFPLRIPAIAILAGLMAGAFLRPLPIHTDSPP